jgi:hypothetical protein
VGVSLVISGGHPGTQWHGSLGVGDLLVLGGVLSFILYTIGAADHRDLSALRYTALTAALGWPAIAAATLVGTAAGWLSAPGGDDWVAVTPALITIGALVANNLLMRPRPVADQSEAEPEEELLEAA